MSQPLLIALDIDGTLLREDGHVSDEVLAQVARVAVQARPSLADSPRVSRA